MSMCRCAPSSFARRSSGRRRSAASRLPRSGASGRSSGVSADTFTDRLARGSTPAPSASSCAAARPRARGLRDRVQRVDAAVRVALRLGLGHGRLAEQVDRGRDAVLPQVAQVAQRRLRRLADDEALRHVLARRAAAASPSARRPAFELPIRIATLIDGGRLVDLAEEAGEVAREVVEVAGRGHDVDEAEQRGLELGVRGREVHRLVVHRLQRVARGGQRARQALPDLEQLALERGSVDHAKDVYDPWPALNAC